jgi:hypothetical protein
VRELNAGRRRALPETATLIANQVTAVMMLAAFRSD